MSEIEADNPTAVEEERYWNPEEDMNFIVLTIDDQFGAIGQYEDGELDLHWLNDDGTFKGGHKRLSTGDEDVLSLSDACSPEQHRFDVGPNFTDDDRPTAICAGCGLAHETIVKLAHPDTSPRSPYLCIECGTTFTDARPSVMTDDGRVCGDCRDGDEA